MTVDEVKAEAEAGRLHPVYLACGEDLGRLPALLAVLRDAVVRDGGAEVDVARFDATQAAAAEWSDAFLTPSWTGGGRLVVVEHAERARFAGGEGAHLAQAASAEPGGSCLVLVFHAERVPAARLKELAGVAQVVELDDVVPGDAERWIEAEAARRGVSLEREAARRLITGVSGRARLEGELDKLAAYAGFQGVVRAVDVERLVGLVREESVFAVIDAVYEGKPQAALDGITRLLDSGIDPLQLLGLIARQERLSGRCRALAARGLSQGEIAGLLGVRPFVVRKSLALAGRVQLRPEEQVERLRRLLEADLQVKSGYRPEVVLDLLVWALMPAAAPRSGGRAPGLSPRSRRASG